MTKTQVNKQEITLMSNYNESDEAKTQWYDFLTYLKVSFEKKPFANWKNIFEHIKNALKEIERNYTDNDMSGNHYKICTNWLLAIDDFLALEQ